MSSTEKSTLSSILIFKAFLGGVASLTAGSVTHPIELVKIRFQMQNQSSQSKTYRSFPQATVHIIKTEGITALYKGITAQWFKESIYSTLRLGTYEPLRNMISGESDPAKTKFLAKFVAGGFAGLIGSTFSAPADILKVRMQAWENPKTQSLRWHLSDIYQNWGFEGFLKGVYPTIVRAVVLNAVFLSTYDHIKHFLIKNRYLPDGMTNHFVSSMLSGLCITLTTSPFDVVKTRI
jgi:hypothetical protein